MPDNPIPFHRPLLDDDDIAQVTKCLRSGWLTTGQRTMEFEKNFAEYIGSRHAIAVNSCTAAMHLALAALGVGPGNEVITSPYTFVATCEAIQYLGARPVFVDIDPVTMNLNPDLLAGALTERTRAIVPVHLAGHPADMAKILAFAAAHHLKVMDDAAHALEASVQLSVNSNQYPVGGNQRAARGDWMQNTDNWSLTTDHSSLITDNRSLITGKIGTLGDATCFSFYATKNLTTGEGGMVTCADDDLAARIRRLSLHGLSRDAWKRYTAAGSWYYEVIEQGYKYNLTDIAAALGLSQLTKVEAMWRRRAEIAARYNAAFADVPELLIPGVKPGIRHAWHLYILRLQLESLAVNRNEFFEEMRRHGVSCSVHFIPLHLMPHYHQAYGHRRGDFPEAERQFERAISLPLYPALTDTEVERVIATVRQVIAAHRRQSSTTPARKSHEFHKTAFV
jgi:dTDP-4-amino-4,6-dideoxygalactose transaminase